MKRPEGYVAFIVGHRYVFVGIVVVLSIIVLLIVGMDNFSESLAQDDPLIGTTLDLRESDNRFIVLETLFNELEIEKLHISDLADADKRARVVETQVLILRSMREEVEMAHNLKKVKR